MREGWKQFKLGELLEIKYGKDHKKLDDGKYPLYGSGGIMRYVNKYLYDDESILIPRKGTLTNLFYLNTPFSTVDTMFWSKIDKVKVFPKFLYYLLKTYDFSTLDEGAAIPSLTTKTLNVVSINIPENKETQRKIASILSGYDDLIETNLKRIKILEEMAQQTYEEWFVRMRFPGASASLSHQSEPETERSRSLPENWEKVKLGKLWEIQSSKRIYLSDYVEFGIPFFRGKEITQKSGNSNVSDMLYISELKFNELKNKFGAPKSGDILLTAVGTLGNLYMVKETDDEFYFKDGNLIWLKDNNSFSSYFLFYTLKSFAFQNHLNNIAIGSSQKALTIKGLKESEIIYPTKEIIRIFDEIVKPINFSIENLQSQNQRLRESRDLLLPRLMMGMIEV